MADQPGPVVISFSAEVNANTTEQLIGVFANEINKGRQEIWLALSTPGGNVREGMVAYNMLRAMPINLTTYNVGMVDSIGNVIFLAGEKRYACKTSRFMFHGVGFSLPQAARFEEKDLREKLGGVQSDQGLMADIICERSNIDAKEANRLFLEAGFFGAEEACEKGLVHEVRDLSVPQGVDVLQLVFKR